MLPLHQKNEGDSGIPLGWGSQPPQLLPPSTRHSGERMLLVAQQAKMAWMQLIRSEGPVEASEPHTFRTLTTRGLLMLDTHGTGPPPGVSIRAVMGPEAKASTQEQNVPDY